MSESVKGAMPRFAKPTCRGSYLLGTACGNCERCAWERGASVVPPSAAPSEPTPDLRAVLREHWLTSVECLHDSKQDIAHCYCTVWASAPQPSVGAAIDAWVEHVMEIING